MAIALPFGGRASQPLGMRRPVRLRHPRATPRLKENQQPATRRNTDRRSSISVL